MKILLINGSPHKEGCTFTALSEIEGALKQEGIETEIFHIGTKAVHGCTACMKCEYLHKCIFDDDPANTIIDKMKTCDGVIFGAPVHYGKPAAALLALLDRVAFAGTDVLMHKPGAAIVSARRGGTTASIDALNKYFQICGMPTVPSKYWPMVHGFTPDDVRQDLEGLQVMRMLGKNMAWMLKSIDAGKKAGVNPPQPEAVDMRTNFIK